MMSLEQAPTHSLVWVFFLIQYLTISRTLCRKTAKPEGREYEEGMIIILKYAKNGAKKGAVSTEVESRTKKKKKEKNIQLQQRQLPLDTQQNFLTVRTENLSDGLPEKDWQALRVIQTSI